MTVASGETLEITIDDHAVTVVDVGQSLLDVLRDQLGIASVKDGCSPQGQCGCCTVLIDDAPRVSCVTPARRVRGRRVTTLDGLDEGARTAWADAFAAAGASQCGFCTPGIICRLEGARLNGADLTDPTTTAKALQAHLCRCTGWQTITEAAVAVGTRSISGRSAPSSGAASRAAMEGRTPQVVGAEVALGRGGFADDAAPADALVAVPDGAGGWSVGETLFEARQAAGRVQGRRTTASVLAPIVVPPGEWNLTLRTSWVEPGYLETDASWCAPGGQPASPLANGGAFGAKVSSPVSAAARELADRHGRAVRVLLSREDTVRLGPKRPPLAAGIDADGSGVVRVAATPGIADAITAAAPRLTVEEVAVPGPATTTAIRGAGWAEGAVLMAALAGEAEVVHPEGATARAAIEGGTIRVSVSCGEPLDETVLRSYCIGAAHMGYSWVTSEGLAVTPDGEIEDLTIRSFGIVKALDMPPVDVDITGVDGAPVNGSDAVFAAVAAAVWLDQGCPQDWPTGAGSVPHAP